VSEKQGQALRVFEKKTSNSIDNVKVRVSFFSKKPCFSLTTLLFQKVYFISFFSIFCLFVSGGCGGFDVPQF